MSNPPSGEASARSAPFDPVTSRPYAWPFDGDWRRSDTALVVMDAQRWLTDALAASAQAGAVRQAIAQAVQAARGVRIPIVFTRRLRDPRADPYSVALRRAGLNRDSGAVDAWPPLPDDPAASFAWPSMIRPDDWLLDRSAWNAFNGTALLARLTDSNIRNLVFCGFTLDGAVHATMRKANDAGFECLLLEDACAASSEAHHPTILEVTRFGNGLFGATARTPDLIAALTP